MIPFLVVLQGDKTFVNNQLSTITNYPSTLATCSNEEKSNNEKIGNTPRFERIASQRALSDGTWAVGSHKNVEHITMTNL